LRRGRIFLKEANVRTNTLVEKAIFVIKTYSPHE
jgi:hypothetical protein